MSKTNKVIDSIMFVTIGFVSGVILNRCTTSKEIVEIEKPIEVIKTVEVEKPVEVVKVVEKVIYKEPEPMEYEADNLVWSDTELTDEKAKEILEDGDLWCYYVIDNTKDGKRVLRLRKLFHQGDEFIRFEAMGNFPIIYSAKELI